MPDFTGKIVLITGAAQGMGSAHARAFHARGATVILADVSDHQGESIAKELGSRGHYVHLDVTDEQEWRTVVDWADAELGGIHVLVNNAGIGVFAGVLDQTAEDFRKVLDVNVTGVFLGMRAVLGGMCRRGSGAVVNISSISGMMALPGGIAYAASKWAVRGMTKASALDVAGRGVRINSVHPGFIGTDMSAHVPPEMYERQPLPRMGTEDEVTQVVLFAASEEASFCTGAEFVVDGGHTIGQTFAFLKSAQTAAEQDV